MQERPFSLMIVDENSEVRESLSSLFLSVGYEVTEADGSAETLPRVLESKRPDAILLGHSPSMQTPEDLLGTLRALRHEAFEQVPVIVFPSFPVAVAQSQGESAPKSVQACRVSTFTNLFTLLRGLARRQLPQQAS